jgi:Fic family protein
VDIFPDISLDKRIETLRSGVFKLQIGLEQKDIAVLYQRVQDAQQRFKDSPLSHVATSLEKEVVVRSIYGTNTIEGGTLTEEETEQVIALSPEQVQSTEQQRAYNLKQAYDFIRQRSVQDAWQPSVSDVCTIHRMVYGGIPSDNPYTPPQLGKDIRVLLQSLMDWNLQLATQGVPALIRAPLVHLYFELIHPFWDGNGRVGRVLEAGILYADGFRYAPFAQANFYLKHIHRYFAAFNYCRKAANKKHENPNLEFVSLFLEGMFATINHLHARVNRLVDSVLYETRLKHLYDEKTINARQYAIMIQLLKYARPVLLAELRKEPWYLALYSKLTDKTKSRDLGNLKKLNLLVDVGKGKIAPSLFRT